MFSPESRELLSEISRNLQGIGRRVQSPKNDVEDLRILTDALKLSAVALETTTGVIIIEQDL